MDGLEALWCMDACVVSVEGLTSDEIEAKWMTVGKE